MYKNIVTSQLAGGLGNYLFQIAAAYSYALKHGKKPVFNTNLSIKVHRGIECYFDNILRSIEKKDTVATQTTIGEQGFQFTELPFVANGVALTGYFQSEKYFKEYEKEIKDLFSCPDHIKESINKRFPSMDSVESCSIHVRRGDYVKLQDIHPVQSMPYFMKALNKMPKDCSIFVFSDDIEWCKNSFPDMGERIHFVEGYSDVEDLYLMSMCDHNIISNSTFSWWAAWLNDNPKKIVVAPKKWFGPMNSHLDTKDIYPEKWEKI